MRIDRGHSDGFHRDSAYQIALELAAAVVASAWAVGLRNHA